MFLFIFIIVADLAAAVEPDIESDPATYQVALFKKRTDGPVGVITSEAGAPIPYSKATNTLNTRLLNNIFFTESISHVNRERLPVRIVHGKAGGAFGYFQVTHNISHICKADFLNKVGKKTPVAVRFSLASGERGSSDLKRDTRGFAIKFYTRKGNFDIVGFNTPMFFFKDPIHFPHIRHSFGRNPSTNLFDATTFWDIMTHLPEMIFMEMLVFADRGIPASYRNMPGFGIHTFQVENDRGDQHFVRFHFTPDGGIKNLFSEEAFNISARDPDYLTRDLYRAIGNGDYPSWTASLQILTEADVKKLGPQAFDVTRVIPLDKYPLHPFGKLVLNRNPKNFHADVEQMALCPLNLVDGILGAPDIMFEARRMAYRDAQLYRLGANFNNIRVNCPFQVKTFTYNRDGLPPVGDNEEDIPNYYPNSFYGPIPSMDDDKSKLIEIVEYKPNNFDQAALLYTNEIVGDEKVRFIDNIVFSLQRAAKCTQQKMVELFTRIHPDFGKRVREGLNCSLNN